MQTVAWLGAPGELFERSADRFGPVFTIRVAGLGPHVYIADPALVREVFTGDPRLFHAGEAYELTEPVGGPRSIFRLDEDDHLRMRRLILPPLHGTRVKRWRPLIERTTIDRIGSWPLSRPFAVRPTMEAITLDVIMRIVFGIREPERAGELRRLLPRLFSVTPAQAPGFLNPALRRDLGRLSPWGRFYRLRDRIDALLYAEIAQRRAELGAGGDGSADRDDMLSLLLQARDEDGRALDDGELRDQLVTMLLAGHETTASSLSWIFERVLRHPAMLERLTAELDAGEDAYLAAVIKETLRVRPVGPHVARTATSDVVLGGHTIPAGTRIAIPIARIQRSEELFPDPGAFRPERFLDGSPEPYAFIPFGGGVRRCPGAALATLEMEVVVATVLRRLRLRAARAEDERPEPLGVTLVPSRGGEVVVEGRRGQDAGGPPRRASSSTA